MRPGWQEDSKREKEIARSLEAIVRVIGSDGAK